LRAGGKPGNHDEEKRLQPRVESHPAFGFADHLFSPLTSLSITIEPVKQALLLR
jgi:hypothetical protein